MGQHSVGSFVNLANCPMMRLLKLLLTLPPRPTPKPSTRSHAGFN
uniref:Uncharacterized protein n=1 Tax=Parascaris equorum TaxID=6256 RepID=A0A914RS05_PAREQ